MSRQSQELLKYALAPSVNVVRSMLLASILALGLAATAAAQQKDAAAPRPPYLVVGSEHLIVVFEADESALKSLLPPGVKPAAGNVVGLNMYRTQQVVGLVPYTASYLWINVDGFDSPDGTTKGRWMAQGWYGPDPVSSTFRSQAGFPVQLGTTKLERDGNRVHAVLTSGGVDLIDAVITLKEEKPAAAAGLFNYPTLSRNLAQPVPSAVVVNRIPFSGEITPATPVSVQFHFSNNDAARMLQPKRLMDAVYVKGNAFTLGVVDMSPAEMSASR
jgi:hypothetical protein